MILFCLFLNAVGYHQLQTCSHSITDCLAFEALALVVCNDLLAYVSGERHVFTGN